MSTTLSRLLFATVACATTPALADDFYARLADADVVAVAPLPGRATIPAVKPDWCGGKIGNTDRYRREAAIPGDSYTLRSLTELAKLSCNNAQADTTAWKKQVASWRQGWVNTTQLTDKEDRAYWALLVDDKRRSEQLVAACNAIPKAEAETPPEQKERLDAYRLILGCNGEGTQMGLAGSRFRNYGWWIDRRPESDSELMKAFWVEQAMMGHSAGKLPDAKDPEIVAGYVAAAADGRTLDRKRLEDELTKLGWNEYARLRALELHGIARTLNEHLTKAYEKLAASDPDVQKVVLDEPRKAFENWTKTYEQNKASYEALWAFEDKLYGPRKSDVAGCAPQLLDQIRKYLGAVKGFTAAKLNTFANPDPVLHSTIVALIDCHERLGDKLSARIWSRLLRFRNEVVRGGRTVAYSMLVWHARKVRKDRPGFFIDPDKLELQLNEKRDHAGQNPNIEEIEGEVVSTKKQDDGVLVTFKTVTSKEDVNHCVDTNKVYRIWPDGRIEWEQNCRTVGSKDVKTTPPPLLTSPEFADALKKGQYVFARVDRAANDEDMTPRRGIPVEVYADKKLKQQVRYYGIPVTGAK